MWDANYQFRALMANDLRFHFLFEMKDNVPLISFGIPVLKFNINSTRVLISNLNDSNDLEIVKDEKDVNFKIEGYFINIFKYFLVENLLLKIDLSEKKS